MALSTLLFVVVVSCAPQTAAAQATDAEALRAEIRSLAERTLKSGPVAGLSIGVARHGEVFLVQGFGLADLESASPATEHTVYRIGSMTKQFTAAAVMQLVEEGRLALDDPLTKFAPDFVVAGHRVTLRHLLNHTSGIPSYTGSPDIERVMRGVKGPGEVLALVKDRPLNFDPGEEFSYNNTGYFMAGEILARTEGRPYDQVIANRIFAPLGMTESTYGWEQPIVKHRAQGYKLVGGKFVNDDPIDMFVPGGAGALASTVGDLLKWAKALQELAVVGDASYAEMTTPTRLNDGTTVDYGFGLAVVDVDGHPTVGHGGDIKGFNSFIEWYPEDELTVVVLANNEGDFATELSHRITRLFLQPKPAVANELPLPAKEFARCVGTYERKGGRIVIAAKDDHLTARLGSTSPTLLYRGERDGALEFRNALDQREAFLFRGDAEHATTLMLVAPLSARKFRRAP